MIFKAISILRPEHLGRHVAHVIWTGALLCLVPLSGNAGTILVNQAFTHSTAPGWTLTGTNASLTGGSADPEGDGWLRLTTAGPGESAFVYNQTAFPFSYGLDIKIQYQTWGHTSDIPADGFSMILIDGNTANPQPGGSGGALGYAQNDVRQIGGAPGGILGIGFDEFGNFSTTAEGRNGPGFRAGSIAIRGPGDGTYNSTAANGSPNYGYLVGTGENTAPLVTGVLNQTTRPSDASDMRYAEIVVDATQIPHGHLPISVYITSGGLTTTMIGGYDAFPALSTYYGGSQNIPLTMKFGFAASTGAFNDYHELRSLQISSVGSVITPEPATTGALGLLFLLVGSAKARSVIQRRKKLFRPRR